MDKRRYIQPGERFYALNPEGWPVAEYTVTELNGGVARAQADTGGYMTLCSVRGVKAELAASGHAWHTEELEAAYAFVKRRRRLAPYIGARIAKCKSGAVLDLCFSLLEPGGEELAEAIRAAKLAAGAATYTELAEAIRAAKLAGGA